MQLEDKVRQLEEAVDGLQKKNQRLARRLWSVLAVAGVGLLIAASDGKEGMSKAQTFQLTDADGKVTAQIGYGKAGPNSDEGISFMDADGKVRCRIGWRGRASSFTLFTSEGAVIQSLPIN